MTDGYSVSASDIGIIAGVIATVVVLFALPRAVYDMLYFQVGPARAAEIAAFTGTFSIGVAAISVVLLAADYRTDGLAHWRAVATVIALLAGWSSCIPWC